MTLEQKEPRVFVVDDEGTIANTLAMILRMRGFECRAFTLPHEALQVALETPPDLLITDVVMPLMSGIELAIQMCEHCPNCKVLLFSGQAATADLLHTARTGGHQFELLTKPVHPADLLDKIREVFES